MLGKYSDVVYETIMRSSCTQKNLQEAVERSFNKLFYRQ